LKRRGHIVGPWGFGGRVVKSRKTLPDTVQCWAAKYAGTGIPPPNMGERSKECTPTKNMLENT